MLRPLWFKPVVTSLCSIASSENTHCRMAGQSWLPGTAIRIAVPGSHDCPAIRQCVFSELAIEHKLVTTGLNHSGRSIQFVKEEDPFSLGWQKIRRCPLRTSVWAKEGQAAQVDWVEQQRSDVLQGNL